MLNQLIVEPLLHTDKTPGGMISAEFQYKHSQTENWVEGTAVTLTIQEAYQAADALAAAGQVLVKDKVRRLHNVDTPRDVEKHSHTTPSFKDIYTRDDAATATLHIIIALTNLHTATGTNPSWFMAHRTRPITIMDSESDDIKDEISRGFRAYHLLQTRSWEFNPEDRTGRIAGDKGKVYQVLLPGNWPGSEANCTCPDFDDQNGKDSFCKHIIAFQLWWENYSTDYFEKLRS